MSLGLPHPQREVVRLTTALREIADTAGWYARNDSRLAHEVDHALCVEVLSAAEAALADTGDEQ